MIVIDGSTGEGGGQVLRSSLALSMLTGQPFKLVGIRAKRPKPGLAAQHLASVLAAAELCHAKYKGAALGSTTLVFEPGKVQAGRYEFKIGTAGATTLVLHTVALAAALRGTEPSEFRIHGGTHVAHAPTADFVQTTWAGFYRAFGIEVKVELVKPGFYPRGGGELRAIVTPTQTISACHFTEPVSSSFVTVRSIVASLPETVSERQSQELSKLLHEGQLEFQLQKETWENGPNAAVVVCNRQGRVPLSFTQLGERGKPVERVAADAVNDYRSWAKNACPVDRHSGDQILLPAVFANGPVSYQVEEITQHLLTHREIIQMFIRCKIQIEGELGSPGSVEVVPGV